MTAEVRSLPIADSKAREHVTLSFEAIAQMLAEAEQMGFRRGVHACNVSDQEAVCLQLHHWLSHETRARLYQARLKRELMK